ncbi:MAG: insulinase family protein, partial [Pseudomonadota bacterium]
RESHPEAWLYDEQARVAEIGFTYQEKSSPSAFVFRSSPLLHKYPPADLLVAGYLMESFDAGLIKQYLGYLVGDNVMVTLTTPEIKGDALEPWFEVPYSLKKQAPTQAAVPAGLFRLPDENPFLPTRLSLKADDNSGPELTIDTPTLDVWLDQDTEFGAPRANLYVTLGVDGGFLTARDRANAQLYRALVENELAALTYPAYLAGLGYSIGVPDTGFEIRVTGYDQKQAELLNAILTNFIDLEIQPQRYELEKAQLLRRWSNARKERPFRQTVAAVNQTLASESWPPANLAAAINAQNLTEFQSWVRDRLTRFNAQMLYHGNVNAADAQRIAAVLKQRLADKPIAWGSGRVREINDNLRLELPIDHNDASMVIHVQAPDDSFEDRALYALGAQILQNRYFKELRTEQQLGYVVTATNRPIHNRPGITFIVQSPVRSAAYLETATQEFMTQFLRDWPEFTDAEFAQQKQGLINRLTQASKNLNERSGKLWSDLKDEHLSFNSREQIAALVADLDKTALTEFYTAVNDKLSNRRLIIYNTGKFGEAPDEGRLLESPTAGF